MIIIIGKSDKPKDCYSCRFNDHNCWCSITKGTIDRDDYTCAVLCPIKQLPNNATNGDIIKALFPKAKYYNEDTSCVTMDMGEHNEYVDFYADWWNAPFNAESEDEGYNNDENRHNE